MLDHAEVERLLLSMHTTMRQMTPNWSSTDEELQQLDRVMEVLGRMIEEMNREAEVGKANEQKQQDSVLDQYLAWVTLHHKDQLSTQPSKEELDLLAFPPACDIDGYPHVTNLLRRFMVTTALEQQPDVFSQYPVILLFWTQRKFKKRGEKPPPTKNLHHDLTTVVLACAPPAVLAEDRGKELNAAFYLVLRQDDKHARCTTSQARKDRERVLRRCTFASFLFDARERIMASCDGSGPRFQNEDALSRWAATVWQPRLVGRIQAAADASPPGEPDNMGLDEHVFDEDFVEKE